MSLNQHPYQSNIHKLHVDSEASITAGNNFSVSQNLKARGKIKYVTFLLTTDVNAANRIVELQLVIGATTILLGGCNLAQGQSDALQYYAFNGAPANITANDVIRFIPLPDVVTTFEDFDLESVITNIQVGDQITNLFIYYEMQFATTQI